MLKKILYFSLIGLLSACTQNQLTMDNKTNNETPKPINQTLLANKPLTAKDIKHPQGKTATPSEIAKCQRQGGKISPQGLG